MSYLREANHMNTFWVFVQRNFKSWKLGMLMKYTQILGHHYTQPIEWFYQATKPIAYEWELDKKLGMRKLSVGSSYTPTNLSLTFNSET